MKNIEQMILYSGTKDIFILKIEADPSSELATDVSAGVHHLAR